MEAVLSGSRSLATDTGKAVQGPSDESLNQRDLTQSQLVLEAFLAASTQVNLACLNPRFSSMLCFKGVDLWSAFLIMLNDMYYVAPPKSRFWIQVQYHSPRL